MLISQMSDTQKYAYDVLNLFPYIHHDTQKYSCFGLGETKINKWTSYFFHVLKCQI